MVDKTFQELIDKINETIKHLRAVTNTQERVVGLEIAKEIIIHKREEQKNGN